MRFLCVCVCVSSLPCRGDLDTRTCRRVYTDAGPKKTENISDTVVCALRACGEARRKEKRMERERDRGEEEE
jgi:hypothetical protein